MKFGRGYRIIIDLGQDGFEPIVITMPITIRFTVQRRLLSSLNNMTIEIYNLSDKVRDIIFQEFYGTPRRKSVTFEAGYNDLALLFKGNIFEAYSYRDGTDIITSIEVKSGYWDLNQADIATTFNPTQGTTTIRDLLVFLAGQIPGIEIGLIGDFPQKIIRPIVLSGDVFSLLRKYSDDSVFIDNNKIYILQKNEVFEGAFPSIDKDTGILDTPRRQGGFLQVRTLFEPRIQIGQVISLESSIVRNYNSTVEGNGGYKVVGLQHQGMISEAMGGQCNTLVDLFAGSQFFRTVVENG